MNNDKNKAKFTPGPWGYEPGRKLEDTYLLGDGRILAVMQFCQSNNKSNAHLIAAAPEMFEALEAALWLALDQLGRESTGQRDHDLVDQINSALAKARGES